MRRDPRCYLWDALRATGSIQAFVRGKTYEAFVEDDLVRSVVERQLQIIGEALSQLAKVDPQIASNVAELGRIIAFRNILVHGYAAIDYDTLGRTESPGSAPVSRFGARLCHRQVASYRFDHRRQARFCSRGTITLPGLRAAEAPRTAGPAQEQERELGLR